MKITIEVPKSVIEFCKKKGVQLKLIPQLYKEYISCINNDNAHSDHPFFNWLEEEGQDTIDELKRKSKVYKREV